MFNRDKIIKNIFWKTWRNDRIFFFDYLYLVSLAIIWKLSI